MVTAGNWISAGGTASATLLTTIVSQDPIYIYFDVSENNYIKYKRLAERGVGAGAADLGAPVEVALPDERGFPHKAQLDFLDNRLDQGTGTLRARAVMANKSGLFSPGLFARVRVTGTAPYAAVLLPDEAIGTDQTNKFVYVVGEDGTRGAPQRQARPAVRGPARGARRPRGRGVGDHQGPAARPARHQGGAQARGADRVRGAGRKAGRRRRRNERGQRHAARAGNATAR